MAFSAVQSWGNNSGGSTTTSITVTVSGATANNLLIGAVTMRNTAIAGSFTASGYTKISEVTSGNTSHAWFYRYATGTSADDFTPVGDAARRISAAVSEFSGLATSSVLETSSENEANVSTGSISTAAGSITPSTAGAAITTAGWEYADWGSGSDVTIDSGFTKFAEYGDNSNFRGRTGIGYKDLTDTSAVNPTWSGASSGNNYVAVAAFAEAAGGGTTITAEVADETDTANSVSPYQSVSVSAAPESNTANTISPAAVVAVGTATESDTAQAIGIAVGIAVGTAEETDSANTIISDFDIIETATESDSANTITPYQIVAVDAANESDSAGSVTPVQVGAVLVGEATESDTANGITIAQIVTVQTATETDSANDASPGLGIPVGTATEGNAALAISPVVYVAVETVLETDSAQAISPPSAEPVYVTAITGSLPSSRIIGSLPSNRITGLSS